MADLRDEIHDALVRIKDPGAELFHADVENVLVVVEDMIDHGALVGAK
jgi:hypothetical protein